MERDSKRVDRELGVWRIGFALLAAIFLLPGAKYASSPLLYVIIVGGLFAGIPLAMGVRILCGNLPVNRHEDVENKTTDLIPASLWPVLGAISGFIAGRVIGREVLKITVFQHTIAAAILASCLFVVFLLTRKKLPSLSGPCILLSTFSLGLLSLR